MHNRTYVVQFSQSPRELREKRYRELCKCYMRGFAWFVATVAFYVASGWFIKWMWYYDRHDMFKFMIFDWEQLCGATFCLWIALGFVGFVKFYCPFCIRYSDYEARHNPNKKWMFFYYQLAVIIYILGFTGVAELMSVVFISAQ